MGAGKLSSEELSLLLANAGQKVEVGALYLHYKQDDRYTVLDLAIHESDDEVMVVYRADYGDRVVFVRSLRSWLETVEYQGRIVSRFRNAH